MKLARPLRLARVLALGGSLLVAGAACEGEEENSDAARPDGSMDGSMDTSVIDSQPEAAGDRPLDMVSIDVNPVDGPAGDVADADPGDGPGEEVPTDAPFIADVGPALPPELIG